MATKKKTHLVTFTLWRVDRNSRTPVTINPAEVVSVVDYCGDVSPGQRIALKNKEVHLVWGAHADVVAKLHAGEK